MRLICPTTAASTSAAGMRRIGLASGMPDRSAPGGNVVAVKPAVLPGMGGRHRHAGRSEDQTFQEGRGYGLTKPRIEALVAYVSHLD